MGQEQQLTGIRHVLRCIPLFSSLSDSELALVSHMASLRYLSAGDCFIHEGELADKFFILETGQVKVHKWDSVDKKHQVLATFDKPHQCLGEVALVDSGKRSASVSAVSDVSLVEIAVDDFVALARDNLTFSKIFISLAGNVGQLLRTSNEKSLQALRELLQAEKLRTFMGLFVLYLIIGMTFFTFLFTGLTQWINIVGGRHILTIPMLLFLAGIACILIYRSHYEWRLFGFTLKNSKAAIIEALYATVFLCVAMVLVKYLVIHYVFEQPQLPLFSLMSGQNISMAVIYVLCVPIQEVVARASLQGALQILVKGRLRYVIAIVGSNLIFSVTHVYLSAVFAVLSMVAGVIWGILFARHRTLVGVILSHLITGVFVFFILGVHFFYL